MPRSFDMSSRLRGQRRGGSSELSTRRILESQTGRNAGRRRDHESIRVGGDSGATAPSKSSPCRWCAVTICPAWSHSCTGAIFSRNGARRPGARSEASRRVHCGIDRGRSGERGAPPCSRPYRVGWLPNDAAGHHPGAYPVHWREAGEAIGTQLSQLVTIRQRFTTLWITNNV